MPNNLRSLPTLVILNNKGGVAKTTNTSLFAEYAALVQGKRVLLIDFDGQCNLTSQWIGHEVVKGERVPPINPNLDPDSPDDLANYNLRSSITDIFYDKLVEPYFTPIGPEDPDDIDSPRVDLIACSQTGMRRLQEVLSVADNDDPDQEGRHVVKGVPTARIVQQLGNFCSNPELSEYYDIILVDTGPGINALFRAALHAATHVLAPYIPESFSILGVGPLIHNITLANRNRFARSEPITFLGLLPSKVDTRNNVHIEIVDMALNKPGISENHVPEDCFVPASVHITRRSTTNRPNQQPYSIFQMKPSEPIRQRCEEVFSYLFDQVFRGEANQNINEGVA